MDVNLDLKQLRTFYEIVRQESFADAATALDIAPSTVTLHVQALESQFGSLLFTRQGRRAELTEAGRTLHTHATQILNEAIVLQDTMHELGDGGAGHVRIGANDSAASILLLPILVQFLDDRPRVKLRLEVGSTTGICERIAASDLDLGLCSPPPPQLGLTFEHLFDERFVLLLPEDHPLACRPSIQVCNLDGQRLLMTEPNCEYRARIEEALLDHGRSPDTGIEIGTIVGLKRAVQAGLGMAILPVAPVIPTPAKTVVREIEGIEIALPVGIVRRPKDGFTGRALDDLIERIWAGMSHPAGVESETGR